DVVSADRESGGDVVYRLKRLPVAMLASLAAGGVSASLGIGGGILKVPVLNAWWGVPMRAGAATSRPHGGGGPPDAGAPCNQRPDDRRARCLLGADSVPPRVREPTARRRGRPRRA